MVKLEQVYTPEEAAEYLKVHVNTIYKMIRAGVLPAAKVGRSWRITGEAILEHLYYRPKQRAGHMPGHIRERFLDAFGEKDVWWKNFDSPQEALVVLGSLWHCTDIVPQLVRTEAAEWLESRGWEEEAERIHRGCTYATLVRVLRPALLEVIAKQEGKA